MRHRVSTVAGWGLAAGIALSANLSHGRALPAGFEDLANGQRERVEVRAFGRSAGLWPAWVSLEHVQLEHPGQVLAALPLPAAAREALGPVLSAPLPRDSHLACAHAHPQPGCGWREAPQDPAQVTAIFDEAEGVLLLFPSTAWLPGDTHRARFHEVAEQAQNALLHQQTLHASGGDGEHALNLQGRAALGVGGSGYLGGSWNYARQQVAGQRTRARFDGDELYYRHDLPPQHYLQVGRMDRRNLSSPVGGQFGLGLLPLGRFDGVRAGTTLAYLDADAADDAVPVSVLLGRDARVDAFDGERLLQTFYLPAGVNLLDTRQFPAGSYLLTLRVYEDGRFVRSETVPFQRGGQGSEHGLQWFVQGGRPREPGQPRSSRRGVAQAGLRLPLAPATHLRFGVAQVEGAGFSELRLGTRQLLGAHDLQAEAGAIGATDGSRGSQLQLSLRHTAAWNLYRQRLRGGSCRRGSRRHGDRLGCSDTTSVSLSWPLLAGNLHLGHTRRRSQLAAFEGREGGPVTRPQLDEAVTRSLQASFTHTRQWRTLSIGTRFSAWQQRSDGSLRAQRDHGLQLGVTVSRLSRTPTAARLQRASVTLRHRRQEALERQLAFAGSWRQEVDGHARELAADTLLQPGGGFDALLAARAYTPWGHSGGTVAHSHAPGRRQLSYSASHGSGVAISRTGIYWGAAGGADAGVAVAIDADPQLALQGAAAEIQAGANRRQILRFGERRLLPVSGYQRHRVDIQDVSAPGQEAAVRVDSGGHGARPFLPPGRLMVVPVEVAATYTYLGRALDDTGAALGGARILNAAVPGLGDDGAFIAEFDQRQPQLYLLHAARLLQCPLQVREQRNVLLRVGPVTCSPLERAQLPAAIARQPRVQRLLGEQVPVAVGGS